MVALATLLPGAASAEEQPELPSISYEGATYVLGNIGGSGHESFNEYFPEGTKPADAKQFLALRHYPNISDPKKFVSGFSKDLQSQDPPARVETIATPDENTAGLGFILSGPNGMLEYNLFFCAKLPSIPGMFVKQMVYKGSGDIDDFQAETRKKSLIWLKEIVSTKFPPLIPPKRQQAGPMTLEIREESVGDVDLPGLSIKGLSVGTKIKVDDAFAEKWENEPPSVPFEVIVPKNERILAIAGGKKTGTPELLRVTLADKEKKKALEIARFTHLSVERGDDPEARIQACAQLLQKQGLAGVFRGKREPKVFEVYKTKVGKNDAVVIHGQAKEANSEEVYFIKLVGVLDPNSSGGVMAYLTAHSELSSVKSFEDFGSKGVGMRVLHSLQFIE